MIYWSAKDWRIGVLVWTCALIFWIPFVYAWRSSATSVWFLVFLTGNSVLLLSLWFGTYYRIVEDQLFWRTGPFSGRIKVSNIITIYKNKSLWSLNGYHKPALSKNALILQIGKYDEIALSPKEHEMFIKTLKEMNPEIKIVNETGLV